MRVLQHRLSEGARLEKERGKEKVALQEALITSEEERLEIAKALIDFQVSHEEQLQFKVPIPSLIVPRKMARLGSKTMLTHHSSSFFFFEGGAQPGNRGGGAAQV